jgi:hypothetical protein
MYQESRAYTTKTKPYTLCITAQRYSHTKASWYVVTEDRHSFRSEQAIAKYLARNVILPNQTWILSHFGQAVRPLGRVRRLVLWGFHQAPNSIMRTELDVNPLVERAKIIAGN